MKKIIIIIGLVVLMGFSFYLLNKTPKETISIEDQEVVVIQEPKLPETLFTFKKEELSPQCASENAQLCAVENAVKCTINPELEGCDKFNLPQFIFMKDSGIDRPSEISYKFTDKKILNNQNVEFYTDSTCNGTWFGLCHGRVIYVLAPLGDDKWSVKDIYAIEQ